MLQFFNALTSWILQFFNALNSLVFVINGVSIPYGWLIVGFLGLFMFLNTFVKGAKA